MRVTQILFAAIIVFFIYKTLVSFRKGYLSVFFTSIWTFMLLAGLFFIFEQTTLVRIASLMGIGRGVDFALYLLILFILYLIYSLFEKIQKIQEDLTSLARKHAILNPIKQTAKTFKRKTAKSKKKFRKL
ncbi:MAG: hypothetical protein ACD_19C00275G0002 [uncultured bacterium]|nr:MAG: hypothetical protein ACD_19C00275G0002 [uncultured bacterium]